VEDSTITILSLTQHLNQIPTILGSMKIRYYSNQTVSKEIHLLFLELMSLSYLTLLSFAKMLHLNQTHDLLELPISQSNTRDQTPELQALTTSVLV
jgi:hypothetical protein